MYFYFVIDFILLFIAELTDLRKNKVQAFKKNLVCFSFEVDVERTFISYTVFLIDSIEI